MLDCGERSLARTSGSIAADENMVLVGVTSVLSTVANSLRAEATGRTRYQR